MKRLLFAGCAATGLLLAGQAYANLELAQKNGCMACHAIDKKVVGPAYKDVAAKYKGNKDAEAMLIEKVKKGSAGVWGPKESSVMPPNTQVKDEDVKTLVKWVLSQ